MDDKVRDLLERIRGAADFAADAAVDTARTAGKRAGQVVDVAKLNVQLFDLNGEFNDTLRQLGQVMYDAHLGRDTGDESVVSLLERADEQAARITEVKDRITALRHSKVCPSCAAPCGMEDKFCRHCGGQL